MKFVVISLKINLKEYKQLEKRKESAIVTELILSIFSLKIIGQYNFH